MANHPLAAFFIIGLTAWSCLFDSKALAQPGTSMATATNRFLQTLQPEELAKTTYSITDSARLKWTNLPVGLVPRPGIQYGSLSDSSRIAFHRVLGSVLSSQGYLKLTSIMQLDDILNELYQKAYDRGEINQQLLKRLQDLKWAHGNYYISVWGKPQDKAPWGINFGGHHIALNMTFSGTTASVTPLFIGTDPAEVRRDKYAGLRILSKEDDYGYLLLNALSESQKKKAIINRDIPKDIITSPNSSQRIEGYSGLAAREMTKDQKEILKLVIMEYTHNFEHSVAHRIYDHILKTGLDKVYFAWIGSQDYTKPHYYLVNGPDFLIEMDNYQGNGNHIHAILREKKNDFGEDLLKKHYLTSEHHKP